MRQPKYSKEEHARICTALYEQQIRPLVEGSNEGRVLAIDVDTGEYEMAENALAASDLLFARVPDAQIWFVRVGHAGVHRFGIRRYMQRVSVLAQILITSGPTRQYLDPVRYLTNASSGRMGKALAEAALASGHQVTIISGPVEVAYPVAAQVVNVISTEEMLAAARERFAACDGLIGVAAPCDYRPVKVEPHKIAKTGEPLELHLIETPDIVATLGAEKKPGQWVVGFALETEDQRFRALVKLEKKSCDLIVLNGPQAMNAPDNSVEVLDRTGQVVAAIAGTKEQVAGGILAMIKERLLR